MIGPASHLEGDGGTSASVGRIVQPGRNCWRVERASRFYCIQDAAAYFRLVRQALLSARTTVFSLGWDITANVDLDPGAAAPDAPTRLDKLLAYVARRRPRLLSGCRLEIHGATFRAGADVMMNEPVGVMSGISPM